MEGVGCLSVCPLGQAMGGRTANLRPNSPQFGQCRGRGHERGRLSCLSVCPLRQAMGGRTANLRPNSPQFGQCTGRGHGRGRLSVCLSVHLDKLFKDVQHIFASVFLSLDNVQEEAMEGVGCLSVCLST